MKNDMILNSSRISSRISVARVIAAAVNYPAYLESVARACMVMGVEVTVHHGDYNRSGFFSGAVELAAGIDLRWTESFLGPKWTVTTPAGEVIDRPFGEGIFPQPLHVALKAKELVCQKERKRQDLYLKAQETRQRLATAAKALLHQRYYNATFDELPWCPNCKLDMCIDTGKCACDNMVFGMLIVPSITR
ncbi:hypothetical protein [Nocardiopsis synnemataformans]|uniref:hypothetical protein n=1 Tax=Nocardiopsis synnemataformans TaxID=61305 RepID=UPI003EBD61B1